MNALTRRFSDLSLSTVTYLKDPFVGSMFALCAFSISATLFFLFLLPSPHSVAADGVAPAVATTATSVRPLEVHIAANGLVLLRSVQVVALDGTNITVSTAWGEKDMRWVVHTNPSNFGPHSFGTKFLTLTGGAASLSDVQVGNLITVTGMLDTTTGELAVNADSVRNSQ